MSGAGPAGRVAAITLLCVAAGLGCQAVGAFADSRPMGATGAVILLLASALAAYMLIEKF